MVALAQAIGIEVKLIIADEGYNDSDGSFYKETGVHLITPASSKMCLSRSMLILRSWRYSMINSVKSLCSTWAVKSSMNLDVVHPLVNTLFLGNALNVGLFPLTAFFSKDSYDTEHVSEALNIRKNAERPLNLLKNREGLEQVRARSQHTLLARCTFTTIATLLFKFLPYIFIKNFLILL